MSKRGSDKVIRLIELDGLGILEGGPLGLIPFAPLMKPPEGMGSAAWLRQGIHAAHVLPQDRSIIRPIFSLV